LSILVVKLKILEEIFSPVVNPLENAQVTSPEMNKVKVEKAPTLPKVSFKIF
jgi:hypothetical protein